MTRSLSRCIASIPLLFLALASGTGRAADPPDYDIRAERRALRERYYQEVQRVEDAVRQGTLSREEASRRLAELNARRFQTARSGASRYTTAYRELMEEARQIREEWSAGYRTRTGRPDPGWKPPVNSGTPLDSPSSRGIFGDQDLTFASEADRAALVEAARRKGYTVKGRLSDGYVVIEELDIAAHGPTVRPANPVSPQGRLHTAELVQGHESFATPGSRQLWIPGERTEWTRRDTLGQVADNIKKAEHDLRRDPSGLRSWAEREEWAQNLSKATGRAMDAAGKSEQELEAALAAARREGRPATVIRNLEKDLAFRRQLAAIKTRMDPRAAGLVPPGASPEETRRILKEFQEKALRQFHEAYRTGVAQNRKLLAEMDARISRLRAAGKTAEADALLMERAWIADADAQALRHLATSPDDGGRLLAEIVSGSKLEAVRTPRGIRYRTPTGELLTADDVKAIARRAAEAPGGGTHAGGKGWSKAQIADAVLTFVILPAIHGTEKELEDAAREGRDPRALYALVNTAWESTQIPEIQRSYSRGQAISRDEIRKELDRIKAMIDRGEQPSAIESALRAVLLSIGRVTGITDILEAGGEFAGLLEATWNELGGPPGDVDALVRQRSGKMLAFVERETAEIERIRDEISGLLDRAADPMERMRKAELELYSMKARLERSRQALMDLRTRCTDARRFRSQFDAEEPNLTPERERALRELKAFAAAVEELCAAAPGERSAALAVATGARESTGDALETWETTLASLQETAGSLKDELDAMERIRQESDPGGLLAAAPEVLERARGAGEEAATSIEPAIALAAEVAEREKKVRLYLRMLAEARAEEERTRRDEQRLESAIDAIIDLAPKVAGNRVNSTVESAYASFEGMRSALNLDTLQAEWDAACEPGVSLPDLEALEDEGRRVTEARTRMEGLLGRVADCSNPTHIIGGAIRPTRDAAGIETLHRALPGQEIFLQVELTAHNLDRSDSVAVDLEAVLPDGTIVPLHPPAIVVRPGQEEGHGTTASLTLDTGLEPGTCSVRGSARLQGRSFPLQGTSFEIVRPAFEVGPLYIASAPGALDLDQRFAVGEPISMWVDVSGQAAEDALPPLTALWRIVSPTGTLTELGPTGLTDAVLEGEGVLGSLLGTIGTRGGLPLGEYTVEAVVLLDGTEMARRTGTFELVPLFEDGWILITDDPDNTLPMERFRPGDPLVVIAKMTYNGKDPGRQVHVTVDFGGPDAAIEDLDIEGDRSFEQGPDRGTGAARTVPQVIQEGVYTVTVTLDGGEGQVMEVSDSFTIVWPVQFDGIYTRDGTPPHNYRDRFAGGDGYRWFMGYHFVEVRPGDEYSSAFRCHVQEYDVEVLSSPILGTDVPRPGPATSTFDGVIPPDMPAGVYELQGIVWYNGIGYTSQDLQFRIGQDPTITITSPESGFMVDTKVLVVTGTCADRSLTQATMITNGEAVPIKLDNGSFSAKTVLRPGQNTIRVVAENDSGTGEDSVWGTADINAAALKIVLSWEARGTDIDLWVTDPEGATTNYHHKRPAEGRNLDVDDTSGPGMETYTIEVPLRGQYTVAIHYYADHGYSGSVPFRVQVTTWEATYRERRSGTTGTLHVAAGDRDEPGAVVRFTVPLW